MTIISILQQVSAGAGVCGFLHQEPMKQNQDTSNFWALRGSSPLKPVPSLEIQSDSFSDLLYIPLRCIFSRI